MNFENSARKRLRPFDHGPLAQLIRCLTPPQSNTYLNALSRASEFRSAAVSAPRWI